MDEEKLNNPSNNSATNRSQTNLGEGWWQPALIIFAQVTGWIAGPIILALFIGKWLDNKYQSEPWLFLISIGAGFAVSSIGIVRITLNYIKKIEQSASASTPAKAFSLRSRSGYFGEVGSVDKKATADKESRAKKDEEKLK